MRQIADWLEKLGMSEYAQRFAENRIDFAVLPDLTDQDLKDLGVVLGDRRKILRAIAKLSVTPEVVKLTPEPITTLSIVAEQLTNPEESSEHHQFIVMFCELRDSTNTAAKLGSGEWANLVEVYLDAASAAITDMGGKVAETRAEGLIALFGYPTAQENDPALAIRAALATQRALSELSRTNADSGRPTLAACIVIDSGPVLIDAAGEIVGDVPKIVRHAQTVDESGAVLVTGRIQQQVVGLFVGEERGSLQLEGVPEAVTLYGIIEASGSGVLRTNYYQLIARAVQGLDRNTGEARRALYERARKALVAQMRSNQLALLTSDIVKERLALEDAIRKVEAEAARKSQTELGIASRPVGAPENNAQASTGKPRRDFTTPPPANQPAIGLPAAPFAHERLLSGRSSLEKQAAKGFREVVREVHTDTAPDRGVRAAVGKPRRHRVNPPLADLPGTGLPAMLPDARQRLLNGQSSREKQAVNGFRNVVRDVHDARPVTSKGAKTVRHTGEAYEFEAPEYIQAEEPAAFPHDLEPNLDLRDLNWGENDTQQERDFELANQPQDELPIAVPQVPTPRRRTPVRQMPHHAAPQQQHARVASLLSYGGLARLLVVLVILIGMAAAISWQWSAIAEFYYFLSHSERKSQIPTSRGSRPVQQKFSGRVPQERVDGQAGEPAAPSIPPNGG